MSYYKVINSRKCKEGDTAVQTLEEEEVGVNDTIRLSQTWWPRCERVAGYLYLRSAGM